MHAASFAAGVPTGPRNGRGAGSRIVSVEKERPGKGRAAGWASFSGVSSIVGLSPERRAIGENSPRMRGGERCAGRGGLSRVPRRLMSGADVATSVVAEGVCVPRVVSQRTPPGEPACTEVSQVRDAIFGGDLASARSRSSSSSASSILIVCVAYVIVSSISPIFAS